MGIPAPSTTGDLWHAFLSILMEGVPYILLGALVSGIIDAWLPSNAMDRLLPRRTLPAILLSGFMGIIFPVCECAIVPVIRRLVQKGLPLGCAMTYMLAAPIVNPIVGLSTWTAFQGRFIGVENPQPLSTVMTESRLLMGYIVAVIVGLVISLIPMKSVLRPDLLGKVTDFQKEKQNPQSRRRRGFGEGITHAFSTAQRDFIDVAVYFVIGVIIAAILQTQVIHRPGLQAGIQSVAGNWFLAPAALMLFAFVLSLCSTTDAFVIAADGIFSAPAKLAFLVFGPMFDMKLLFLYSTVLTRKAVLFLGMGLFVLVLCLTFVFQHTFLKEGPPLPKLGPPSAPAATAP